MVYDLILKNANIITMNKDLSTCDWVAVKDGKIACVGKGTCPEKAENEMDLKGQTVLPGLMDCHVHVLIAGLTLSAVNLEAAKNIEEVLALMEAGCKADNEKEWVYGVNYVPQNVEEKRYPTRWELDKISNGHKIMIFAATLHGCAVNTVGVPICGVPEDMPGVEKENGEITGTYTSDESSFLATANALGSLSDEILFGYIEDCANNAVAKGVTTMHGLFGQFVKDDRDIHLILENKERLKLDVIEFYQTWEVEKALALKLPRVGGCLTLDGALFEYTMANFEPFDSAPALRGVLYHTDDEVYQVVSKAHAANIQCTLHAVGERAIDQLLYVYHRVFHEQGKKDLRHRIEHFCLPTEKQIKMAIDLGLILSMQPGFTYLWDKEIGGEFAYILGRERANRWDPFHKIIEAGGMICGGSDCPVTQVEPLIDIATCISGDNPIRNISVTEALKMYTTNAAYAANIETTTGSIEIGKNADFVVIDQDPYEVKGEALYKLNVVYTIKKGIVVYQ